MEKKKYRVLIVEDEVSLLNILTKTFTNEGFEVLQAINGEEGLKLAKTERLDIILLDILMPRMDGLTMLNEMHFLKVGENVPVLVLSNLGSAEDIKSALEAGADDFLVKARWDLDQVVAKVKSMLKKGE